MICVCGFFCGTAISRLKFTGLWPEMSDQNEEFNFRVSLPKERRPLRMNQDGAFLSLKDFEMYVS